LAAFLAIEEVKPKKVWWISSVSGVKATERELRIWKADFKPVLMTYERLLKMVKNNEIKDEDLPDFIVFDEAHKVKTPTAQRSQAAATVADAMREKYGLDAFVILMTGTPAPKDPSDWWHLSRVACPVFLREGTWQKFRARLAIVVARENQVTGGMFPQLVSWRDNEDKCDICGKLQAVHELPPFNADRHPFKKSSNEVVRLYKRMKGLVLPMFKKDCLDLPDKRYEVIRLEPTAEMKRIAQMIASKATRVIERLTLLRELSDGFQYKTIDGPLIKCPECKGKGARLDFILKEDSEEFEEAEVECYYCDGQGEVPRQVRTATDIFTPKADALIELLDAHESGGRLVTYGGFTGTIDKIVALSHKEHWATVRADGRGWVCEDWEENPIKEDALTLFQDMLEEYPRVNFVGHPESAGEGITLTRSPSIVYYSNDFNNKSRLQSEDRIHRIGMDINKGATIYDLCCLETDYMILQNLREKKRLQTITLTGEMFS
jgi:SNF2 family DNA or RNA helicase